MEHSTILVEESSTYVDSTSPPRSPSTLTTSSTYYRNLHDSFSSISSIEHGSSAESTVNATENGITPSTHNNRLQGSADTRPSKHEDRSLWTSFWLCRATLLGLSVIFTGLWVALILLQYYNTQVNGFALSVSSNAYTWTYGPTLVLTILVGVWRQVDYHCKLLQPWKAMQKSPELSTRSVLVDYISPFQIVSLWQASKNRHWTVVLTITAFTLLKVIIVASTTLLVTVSTNLAGNYSITINSKFDGSEFLHSLTANVDLKELPDVDSPNKLFIPAYGNVPMAPVYAVQGMLRKELKPPPQILNNTVVQTFDVENNNTNTTTVTGLMEVFYPNIACETATASLIRSGPGSPFLNLTLDSATCLVGNEQRSMEIIYLCSKSPCVIFRMLRVNCSGDNTNPTIPNILGHGTAHDLRFALVSGNLSKTLDSTNFTEGYLSGIRPTAAICKYDYAIQKLPLTRHLRDNTLSLSPTQNLDTGKHLPGLSSVQLGEVLFDMLQDSVILQEYATYATDAIFILMMSALNGSVKDLTDFFDVETMKSAFIQVFNGLSCSLIQSHFLVPENQTSTGEGLYTENRLYVQALPARLMITGLIILSIISLILSFLAPRQATPQDPAVLAANGIILAKSPSLEHILVGHSSSRQSHLKESLRHFNFKTNFTDVGGFSITPVELSSRLHIHPDEMPHGHDLRDTDAQDNTAVKQWIPLFAQYPIIALTFTLPILAIVVLEVLYQISEKNGGIVDAGRTPLYYVQYPSSLAALIIATLFNSLDFTISAHANFHALCAGPTLSSRGILTNLIQLIPPLAWYRALQNRLFGAASSITAAIIGSLLTIIVSGLWVVDPEVVVSTAVSASVGTTWNTSWPDSYNPDMFKFPVNRGYVASPSEDGEAAKKLKETLTGSASVPDGIWDDLVFPSIVNLTFEETNNLNISERSGHDTLSTLMFSMTVPALRPQLRCEPPLHTAIQTVNGLRRIEASYLLPKSCLIENHKNGSFISSWAAEASRGPFYGQVDDLFLVDNINNAPHSPDNPNGCPSIGIMFGHIKPHQVSLENITALICYQEIQEVETSISFSYGDLEQGLPFEFGGSNIRSAPIINETTARLLTNGSEGIESFHYRVVSNLVEPLWPWDIPPAASDLGSPIFKTILYGPDGIPPESLLGPENRQRLEDSVNRFYKKYMTLVINSSVFRKPLNPAITPAQQLKGSVSTTVARLRVDGLSKLILQVLLALMTVLAAIGVWLTDVRGTLPRDPFSIAGLMALFAGSRFCERARRTPGAEWMDVKELRKLFGGQGLSLGWWDVGGRENEEGEVVERFGVDFGTPVYSGFVKGKRRKLE